MCLQLSTSFFQGRNKSVFGYFCSWTSKIIPVGEGTPPFYACANLGKTKSLNGFQQTLVLGILGRERSELGVVLGGHRSLTSLASVAT